VAIIGQDIRRDSGGMERSIGRFRKGARKLFPLEGPSGDLAFYLRDQFFPRSALVFETAEPNPSDVLKAWARDAANVYWIYKPPEQRDLSRIIRSATKNFRAHFRPTPLSDQGRLLLPVAEELLSITAVSEAALEQMSSRDFERMIEAVFANHGFSTTLTQTSRDGGYDLRLVTPRSSNSEVILVECKKFNPRRCVEVGIVRALYGVKCLKDASAAYLVTSSYVSPYAKREFATVTPVEMKFFERSDVLAWCAEHMSRLFTNRSE
jgi:hypothetical protein